MRGGVLGVGGVDGSKDCEVLIDAAAVKLLEAIVDWKMFAKNFVKYDILGGSPTEIQVPREARVIVQVGNDILEQVKSGATTTSRAARSLRTYLAKMRAIIHRRLVYSIRTNCISFEAVW